MNSVLISELISEWQISSWVQIYEFSHYFQIQKVDANRHSGMPVRFGKEILGTITMP